MVRSWCIVNFDYSSWIYIGKYSWSSNLNSISLVSFSNFNISSSSDILLHLDLIFSLVFINSVQCQRTIKYSFWAFFYISFWLSHPQVFGYNWFWNVWNKSVVRTLLPCTVDNFCLPWWSNYLNNPLSLHIWFFTAVYELNWLLHIFGSPLTLIDIFWCDIIWLLAVSFILVIIIDILIM